MSVNRAPATTRLAVRNGFLSFLESKPWLDWFNALISRLNAPQIESGPYTAAPTGLTSDDAGRLYYVTSPYFHLVMWDGAQWQFADGGNRFVADFPAAPTAGGWKACDGTATDYLVPGVTLTVASYTTRNLTGHYRKSVTAGADALNAAVAPTITGAIAATTALNVAATAVNQDETAVNQATTAVNQATTATNLTNTTGITVGAHPVVERLDDAGSGIWVFDEQADAGHTVTDGGHGHIQNAHNHTQNAHTHTQDPHTHLQNSHNHNQLSHGHGNGTLGVSATGEPANFTVLSYFRR